MQFFEPDAFVFGRAHRVYKNLGILLLQRRSVGILSNTHLVSSPCWILISIFDDLIICWVRSPPCGLWTSAEPGEGTAHV